MRIEDVMTRNPSYCGPDATAADAARLMWERDCGFVPVLDAQRIPIGVVTDRDLARGRSRTAKDRVSEHIFADVAKTLVAITRPHVGSTISAE